MGRHLACLQGHQWEDAGDQPAGGGRGAGCPVCGAPAHPLAETAALAADPGPVAEWSDSLAEAGTVGPGRGQAAPPAGGAALPGYELLGELGRGGMGVIYKARQTSLKRLVALKMIRAGSQAAPEETARFRREAEAAARLQHPNIVQVYEVGEHQGTPFFSLEFVGGGNLAHRLGNRPQPPRPAAEMVQTLARAIHCAHRHGIIHRDLKPANVLLAPDGTPKIADFGLARPLEEPGLTRTNAILGTPSYMAPEQALGQAQEVGPATDVYALGAILYELLTGRPPFQGTTTLETLEHVRSEEPVPPRRLQPKVPRDLQTICLKCLHKAPRKRYASAEALADDLGRFLAGEPIQARPTGPLGRAAKWARRRPAVAAHVALLTLGVPLLLAAAVWNNVRMYWKNREAEENFTDARAAVRLMLTEVSEEDLAHAPQMEDVCRKVLERARGFYQGFLARKRDDPGVRREAGRVYLQLGEAYARLGDHGKAREVDEEALALFAGLVRDFPAEPGYRSDLAAGHFRLGQVRRDAGEYAGAEQSYAEAVRLQEALVASASPWPESRRDLARTANDLGRLLQLTGRPREAEEAYRRALLLQQGLVADYPDEPEYGHDLAGTENDLGSLLLARCRTPEETEPVKAHYDTALAHFHDLVAAYPDRPEYRKGRAATYNNLGVFYEWNGRFAEAEQALGLALADREKLAQQFPRVPAYRRDVALGHSNLAWALAARKQVRAAAASYRKAVEGQRQLLADVGRVPDFESDLAAILDNEARFLSDQQQFEEARRRFQEALPFHLAALEHNPKDLEHLARLRAHYQLLAETLLGQGEHREAATAAASLARVVADGWQDHYQAALLLTRCLRLAEGDSRLAREERDRLAQGDADESVRLLQEAVRRGFGDARQLRQDFALLRERPDFQKLVTALEEKTGEPP